MASEADTDASKATLEFALRAHAIPRETLIARYRPVMMMVRQILGVVPHAMSYFEIWPPALTTYSVMVPSFLDVPRCDLGRGISPDLRSLVLYIASRSYGCSYCAAHSAGVGTVFKGPGGSLERNRKALDASARGLFGPGDQAAIEYATAVAKIPSEVTLAHRVGLAQHFSEEDEEAIVLAATLMGFLNCAMDTLGMVLEWRVLENAEKYLAASNWAPNKNYEARFDQSIVEADKLTDDGDTLGMWSLARTMVGILAYDRDALEGIATRPIRVAEQVRVALGFVPYYLGRIERVSTKRVIAHCLIERIQSEAGSVPVWLRHAIGFVVAKQTQNPLLAAHFALGAVRAGATIRRLVSAVERSGEPGREQAAFDLARASGRAPAGVGQAEIASLTSYWTPASIIELVVVVSICGLLHRYTSTYPVDAYEPEVAAFVAEHGAALGLAPAPSSEGSKWDQQCAKVRQRR